MSGKCAMIALLGIAPALVFTIAGCDPQSGGGLTGPKYYVKKVEVDDARLFRDLGLEVVRFEVKAPPDAKVLIWLETYESGQLVPELSWGQWDNPPLGESVVKQFHFTRFNPDVLTGEETSQSRWGLNFEDIFGHRWVEDPIRQSNLPSWGSAKPVFGLEFGQTQTVWHLIGSYSNRTYADDLMKNDYLVLIKCRIDRASPDRSPVWASGSFTHVPPPVE